MVLLGGIILNEASKYINFLLLTYSLCTTVSIFIFKLEFNIIIQSSILWTLAMKHMSIESYFFRLNINQK